jgi:hypothetical protein
MAVTVEAMLRFGKAVTTLDSFPLFVGYLLMVLLAGLWQKFTKPVPLRPVSHFELIITLQVLTSSRWQSSLKPNDPD